MADVFIYFEGSRSGVYSDAAGRFRLVNVPAGQRVVIAEAMGLSREREQVVLSAGSVAELRFVMHDAPTIIEPMVVVASREAERNRGTARIDALSGRDVRDAHATHPNAIMNRIAGVHVSELSGEGHSMAIRQPITTKPMYLYLEDGVPTRPTGFFNHNALYEVNLPQAGGIEVLKGPGTALYGSDAIGGVVNVLTRAAPTEPTLEASVEGGSFGYVRALLSAGTGTDDFGVRADGNFTRSDNWKNDAPFKRYSGTVRYDRFNARGWQTKTVLTGSSIDQFDVPPLNAVTFSTSPRVNLAPRVAYRTVRALRLTTSFDRQQRGTLWSFTPFARYNELGLLPSWQLTYDPQTWQTNNTSVGMLAKYRRDFGASTRVIAGADVDYSPGSFTAHRALVTRGGPGNAAWTSYRKGDVQYDYDVTYRQLSPYVQLETELLPRLRVEAGLRQDFTGYVYENRLAPLDTGVHRRPASTTVNYAHLSPKLGAAYSPTENITAFAAYRHGFRAPSQSQLFQQNSAANTVDLQPVKVESFEAGLRGTIAERLAFTVSAYDMRIRDDIITFITAQNTREATNAGETRHRGLEVSAGAALLASLRLDASYSLASHKYVEWQPTAAVSFAGKHIEQAPHDMASAVLAWSPHALRGGSVSLQWSHTGRYAADPANTFFYDGYQLLNLQASAVVRQNAELFVRINNLTNRAYAELVSYDAFQKDQYTPGTPRALFAGVKAIIK